MPLRPLPPDRGNNGEVTEPNRTSRVQFPRDDGHSFDETSEDRRKKIAEKIQYEKEMAVEKLRKEQEEKRRVEEEIRNAEAAAKVEAEAKARREAEEAAKAEIERIEKERREKEDADREAKLREKADEEEALRKKKELEDAAERERDDELARRAAAARLGRAENLKRAKEQEAEKRRRFEALEKEYNRTAQKDREAENMAQAAKQQAVASSTTPSDKANKTNVPGSDSDIKGNGSSSPGASDAGSIKVLPSSGEMEGRTEFERTEFEDQLVPRKNQRRKECPSSVMTDTYKATHFLMYKEAKVMSAYGEFRQAYAGMDDDRIVVYGIKYYIDNLIARKIDEKDLACGRDFLKTHILGTRMPEYLKTNGDTYFDLLNRNGGFFPVKIEAMPEGSVIRPHIPVFIITAQGEYSRLCTFLETILTMIWYPSTVATLSRHTRALIEKAFKDSVDGDENDENYKKLLLSRLHDFGFRGCTCVEQSVIGGLAHLLSFTGSDTMSACYYGKEILNNGKEVGFSIPASEHSVMTSYESEVEAVKAVCKEFGSGLFSIVMDAYDYDVAIDNHLKEVAESVKKAGGTFIIRPDSGDAVEQVMKALRKGEEAFGVTCNNKGYKVLNNCAVLQGDGIEYKTVKKILKAVLDNKYSAQNIAFGMGGGLLQKVNRDTMSFATKLSLVDDRPILKAPAPKKVDSSKTGNPSEKNELDPVEDEVNPKTSLPGRLIVLHEVLGKDGAEVDIIGEHVVYSYDVGIKLLNAQGSRYRRSMKVVYDGTRSGKITESSGEGYDDLVNMSEHRDEIRTFEKETFEAVRERLNREWNLFMPPKPAVDSGLENLQKSEIRKIRAQIKRTLGQFSSGVNSEFHEAGDRLVRLLDNILL